MWPIVVDLDHGRLVIRVDLSGIAGRSIPMFEHTIETRIRNRGVERRLVLDADSEGPTTELDPALVKAIARARRWFDSIAKGKVKSISEIAAAEGVSGQYVGKLMPLAFLSPPPVERVVGGTWPVEMTAESLTSRIEIPIDWEEQHEMVERFESSRSAPSEAM